MKAILVTLTVLSLGRSAYAVTDEQKFTKLLNLTTVPTVPVGQIPALSDIVQKAKVACVCRGGQTSATAGVLVRRRFGDERVSFLTSCFVPSFETDGSAVTFFECFDWELLTN
jgi:hypothetical protein